MQGLITFLIVPSSSWEMLVKYIIDSGGRFVPEGGQDSGFTYTLSAVWRIDGGGVDGELFREDAKSGCLMPQILGKDWMVWSLECD